MIEVGPKRRLWLFAFLSITLTAAQSFAQGLYLPMAGPVNRSMGGASTAAPLSALGALYWNPATISGLPQSELEIGLGLLLSNHEVSSSIGGVSGSTEAESGAYPIPNVGWVHHVPDSPVTIGLGVNGVAGFKTNLRSDPANPILAPAPFGLGRVSSEASFLQLAPVLSLAVTDELSVAVGPTITMGQIGIEPFVFAPPNANGVYSPGRATRYHWGGGFQLGVYYVHNCDWHFGTSIKSPTWMEEFRFFGEDAAGASRILRTKIDLPMIVSLGTAYSGLQDWLFALDLRYFDYGNTDGFGDPAIFDSTGKLQGLDWSSVFALAAGVQRHLNEQVSLRAGYTFTQNPIQDSEAFYNIASPLLYQHVVNAGASYKLTENLAINVAYSYVVDNTVEGQVVLPRIGVVPGSSFTNQLSGHLLDFGISARY